jgi:glutathione synthase
MSLDIAVVMDPIGEITPKKDSTFAMLLEGQARGHRMLYVVPGSLGIAQARATALVSELTVVDRPVDWFTLAPPQTIALGELDAVLMRKDPPVDPTFIHDTHVLSLAAQQGARVFNDPQGLRDMNEKLFALNFPELCPPTLVSRRADALLEFIEEHGDCVLKPLDGMGGRSIFRARTGDDNLTVILETLTDRGREQALVQTFLPQISEGDKRILLVDGEPMPYVLARIPTGRDFRGNLATGGRGEARPISDSDRRIAEAVAPEMVRRGMIFVGLDIIGEHLTEVNVTSPTCIREIDAQCGTRIAQRLFERIEARCG